MTDVLVLLLIILGMAFIGACGDVVAAALARRNRPNRLVKSLLKHGKDANE